MSRRRLAPGKIKISIGRLHPGQDFWSLDNEMVGRSRGYQRIVIDEAAFAKNGDKRTAGSMMAIWERSIRPTLYEYGGQALVCSNAAGKDLDNFFYNICTDPRHGFHDEAVRGELVSPCYSLFSPVMFGKMGNFPFLSNDLRSTFFQVLSSFPLVMVFSFRCKNCDHSSAKQGYFFNVSGMLDWVAGGIPNDCESNNCGLRRFFC